MKQALFLLLLAFCGRCATAQQAFPVLTGHANDTNKTATVFGSDYGQRVSVGYYEYCTDVTCFNWGCTLYVKDSLGMLLSRIPLEKPNVRATRSNVSIYDGCFDHSGQHFFITGSFTSLTDFDPNGPAPLILCGDTTFSNTNDLFIAKYSTADGKLAWIKTFKGTSYPMISAVQLINDAQDNLYVFISRFNGTFDFDAGNGVVNISASSGSPLLKYDASGNYLTHTLEAAGTNIRYHKSMRVAGNRLYLLTATDSTTGYNNAWAKYLFRKYDAGSLHLLQSRSTGSFKTYSGGLFRESSRLDYEIYNDTIYFLSRFSDSLSLPAGTGMQHFAYQGSHGTISRCVSVLGRMDTDFNVLEVHRIGQSRDGNYVPVKLGFDGDQLLLTGTVADSVDLELSAGTYWLKATRNTNGFIAAYTRQLALRWARTFGDTANTTLAYARFGKDGKLFILGDYRGSGNFSVDGTTSMKSTLAPAVANDYHAVYRLSGGGATGIGVARRTSGVFALYPNPATTNVSVAYKGSKATYTLSLYDLGGRRIYSEVKKGPLANLPLEGIAPQTYLLLADDGTQQWTTKLVKH